MIIIALHIKGIFVFRITFTKTEKVDLVVTSNLKIGEFILKQY